MNKIIYLGVLVAFICGIVSVGFVSVDLDNLHYTEEMEHNTDPLDYDTDGDGLSDSYEIKNGYNPRHKTILLDIHSEKPLSPEVKERIENIQQRYNNSPVSNPDGSNGINLIVSYDTVDLNRNSVSGSEYETYIQPETFENKGKGHYEVLIVDEVCHNGDCENTSGVTSTYNTGMIVEKDSPYNTARTIMHELGHSVGVTNDDYMGVDTTEISTSEYHSVMNYNKPQEIKYSSSGEFNDWEEIEQSMQYTTNTSKVDNTILQAYKETLYIMNLSKIEQLSTYETIKYVINEHYFKFITPLLLFILSTISYELVKQDD